MYRFPCWKTVALDLENTGINRERDRIIQYGIVGVKEDGETPIDLTSMVDAESDTGRDPCNIPGVQTHQIYKAVPLREGHLEKIYNACHDAVVVIHNKQFDWAFVENEFIRNNASPPRPRLICCTWEIARRLRLPKPHRLSALCQQYKVRLELAHNAHYDATATFQLFVTFANLYWDDWFAQQPRLRGCWSIRSKYFYPKCFPWTKQLVDHS